MKKILVFTFGFLLFFFFVKSAFAYDPHALPNNKVGVHILFPTEIDEASRLINSSGGDWGYVTIPIQASDKDLVKWQKFMDEAKRLHIIPIIRLATDGDYFNTQVWSKPKDTDVLDFANFLNSLSWPTTNRYVVVFNEVNRADEWEGSASPYEYAKILSYAVTTFKSKSQDFFILSSGMDNAAQNGAGTMNQYAFMREMDVAVPGIFNQIDGLSSHSYPNPGFSQPPYSKTLTGVYSFLHEKALAESLSNKTLPVFITETGWSADILPDSTIASYTTTAFTNVWSDPDVIAVTPFLLTAGAPPFQQFSLVNTCGDTFKRYLAIKNLPKTKGKPGIPSNSSVLGSESIFEFDKTKFNINKKTNEVFNKNAANTVFKWFLRI